MESGAALRIKLPISSIRFGDDIEAEMYVFEETWVPPVSDWERLFENATANELQSFISIGGRRIKVPRGHDGVPRILEPLRMTGNKFFTRLSGNRARINRGFCGTFLLSASSLTKFSNKYVDVKGGSLS